MIPVLEFRFLLNGEQFTTAFFIDLTEIVLEFFTPNVLLKPRFVGSNQWLMLSITGCHLKIVQRITRVKAFTAVPDTPSFNLLILVDSLSLLQIESGTVEAMSAAAFALAQLRRSRHRLVTGRSVFCPCCPGRQSVSLPWRTTHSWRDWYSAWRLYVTFQ